MYGHGKIFMTILLKKYIVTTYAIYCLATVNQFKQTYI